jgi:hypothetical protein
LPNRLGCGLKLLSDCNTRQQHFNESSKRLEKHQMHMFFASRRR